MMYQLKKIYWNSFPSEMIESFRETIKFAHAEQNLDGCVVGDPSPFLEIARNTYKRMSLDEQRYIRNHHHPTHYLDMSKK